MQLAAGEQLILRRRANRVEAGTARGGHVHLTNRRIVFEPHSVETSLTGAAFVELPLGDVVGADVAPRTWSRIDGGLRRRPRIQTRSGQPELFVVARPAEVVTELSDLTSGR
jgi:hypothetical protein